MGAGQSGCVEIGGSSMGYQVLRVYPNSPGSKAGLKAYFDFIVAIGNTRFNKEDGSLREILKASVNQKLKMIVYNTRNKLAREVEIVPTTSWGGSGLLGVSIKHSSFDKADERVWHVVEVDPGSPAHQAGFKANEDYVIGSDSILQESDDLYNLIEAHEGKALKLFVYNSKTDNCREVICHPNSKWGGRGFLGCEFGHGLLHRIPYADEQIGNDQNHSSAVITTSKSNNLPMSFQSQSISVSQHQPLQQQPTLLPQMSTQPGHQMFQQALFNQSSSQQQQPSQKPEDKASVLQPPPQAPQTFAQLASAQFQAQQYQQQDQQVRQSGSLNSQQSNESSKLDASHLLPQQPSINYQDGPPMSNTLVSEQQQQPSAQLFQDNPMPQFVQDTVQNFGQPSQQPSQQNGPPVSMTESSPSHGPPQQQQYAHNQMPQNLIGQQQSNQYQQYFNYQSQPEQFQVMSFNNQAIQPNLPQSMQTLPPPPTICPPPPPQASQMAQQQQQLPPPPPPPTNIPNFHQM